MSGRKFTRQIAISAAITLLSVGALAPAAQSASTTNNAITHEWGKHKGGVTSTLRFTEDGKITGTDGCNNFAGTWKATKAALNLKVSVTTYMMCLGSRQMLANRYLSNLDKTTRYAVKGSLLMLFAGEKKLMTLTQRN